MENIAHVGTLRSMPVPAIGAWSHDHAAMVGRVGDTAASIAEIALDALAQGAFVLTADCRLSYANRAGRSMLASAGALQLRGDRIQATGPDAETSLSRMVMATATFGNTSAMCLWTADGTRLTIATKPLRAAEAVLMLVAEIDRGERQSAAQLKSAFGLTPAEADIARLLGTGASPAETASARGALLSTVQSQIKSIASKLGCRRQSEITAIVQTIPKFLEE